MMIQPPFRLSLRVFLALATLLGCAAGAATAQQAPVAPAAQTPSQDDVIEDIARLAEQGRLPDYDALRLPAADAVLMDERYLQTMPLMTGDVVTTDTVFADVDADEPYALLGLRDLIGIALDNNFNLMTSNLGLEIARSETTSAQFFFVPFVDLVGDARTTLFKDDRTADPNNPGRRTSATTRNDRLQGGVEATQNLPTGGRVTGSILEGYSNRRSSIGGSTSRDSSYDADASVRYIQPLLRGSSLPGLVGGDGSVVGQAELRRARLSESSTVINDRLAQRDVVRAVIRQYFQILQLKQQLLVSRDAIAERYRFLNESRIKFEAGRVAESEILRAQIQVLQEIERALNRQQQLDDARDSLLILLGLPLDTRISLVDITEQLIARGRFEFPMNQEAVSIALNNRFELMRADIGLAIAEIDRAVSRNDTLPDLNFDVGYGRSEADDTFRGAQSLADQEFDAGLSLRIPLQTVRRREAARRSVLRYEQRQIDREALERDVTQEVLSTHRSLLTTEARLTVLRRQVEQARRNLELINASFDEGFSTITEVRLAQDDLFNAETAYSNAVLGYQISIAELYIAMGLPLF